MDNLPEILEQHALWLADKGGERAKLSGAHLSGARLHSANLHGADLSGAILIGAGLSLAKLSCAKLHGANLNVANLNGADLRDVYLRDANLSGADLSHTNLSHANLINADLSSADLSYANLRRAKLSGTVLDPERLPNGNVDEFVKDGNYVIGYRTRGAGHIDKYRDGRVYAADWFSTCETECHPGLYLWPTLVYARAWSYDEIIRVRTFPHDVHKAGTKWRCRWFEVLGTARKVFIGERS